MVTMPLSSGLPARGMGVCRRSWEQTQQSPFAECARTGRKTAVPGATAGVNGRPSQLKHGMAQVIMYKSLLDVPDNGALAALTAAAVREVPCWLLG